MSVPGENSTVDPQENRDGAVDSAEVADPSAEAPAAAAPKPEKTAAQKAVEARLAEAELASNNTVAKKTAAAGGVDTDEDEDDEEEGPKDEEEEKPEEESTGFGSIVAYFNEFSKKHPDASMTSALFATALFALKEWATGSKSEAGTDTDEDKDDDSDEDKGTDTQTDAEKNSEKYSESIKKLLAEFGLGEDSDPKKNFYNVAERLAVEVEEKYGVPRRVTLAQALLESGHGQSGLTQSACNCFGIKLGSSTDTEYVEMETTENRGGADRRENAKFRSYASLRDSFMDYGKLLSTSDRYKAAFEHKDDPKRFLQEVIKGGYATDPNYVKKAESVLKPYGGFEPEPTSKRNS